MSETRISENTFPSRFRSWDPVENEADAAMDAAVLLVASRSDQAVKRLAQNPTEETSVHDQADFGRLNYHCFLQGYEPMVSLFSEEPPSIPPGVIEFLKRQDLV